jgi:hypothetical protein
MLTLTVSFCKYFITKNSFFHLFDYKRKTKKYRLCAAAAAAESDIKRFSGQLRI